MKEKRIIKVIFQQHVTGQVITRAFRGSFYWQNLGAYK